MKKKKWAILIIFVTIILFVGIFYLRRPQYFFQEKMHFTFRMHGADNFGMLGIQTKDLNSQMLLKGVVCVNQATNVSKIDLFMPDMGHGSSPPVLSKSNRIPNQLDINPQNKIDYACFNISKMEMFMPGLWQVRVFYNNGTQGLFDVNVTH